MKKKHKNLNFIHVLIILILSVLAFSISSTANDKDGLLKVYFFDIGQGDGILTSVTQHGSNL